MPYKLKGTYYTIREASGLTGLSFSAVCRLLKSEGIETVKISDVYLIPTTSFRELVTRLKESAEYNKAKSQYAAAHMLGIKATDFIRLMVVGIPGVQDGSKMPKVSLETIERIRKSGYCDHPANYLGILNLFVGDLEKCKKLLQSQRLPEINTKQRLSFTRGTVCLDYRPSVCPSNCPARKSDAVIGSCGYFANKRGQDETSL